MDIKLFLCVCVASVFLEEAFAGCGTYTRRNAYTCYKSQSYTKHSSHSCGWWFWKRTCRRSRTMYKRSAFTCYHYQRYNDSWGRWGNWSSWGGCSRSCGPGIKKRSRRRRCIVNYKYSSQYQQTGCYLRCCSRNGGWSVWYSWSGWGSCSKHCGGGYKQRYKIRKCNNPHPYCGGSTCRGSSRTGQATHCNSHCCPRNGGWSWWNNWSSWGSCSKQCGGGHKQRYRSRSCSNPYPSCGGRACSGLKRSYQTSTCNSKCCPRNGGWTNWDNWQSWGQCSKTCGGGKKTRERKRTCSNPRPACSGKPCSGAVVETYTTKCNTQCCRRDGSWKTWEKWNRMGSCSKTCGSGIAVMKRKRLCVYPDPNCKGKSCIGENSETRMENCNTDECPIDCICKASGDPHYRTFDGQMIHFMGTSTYTLAKSTIPNDNCSFNIEVKNEHRYGIYTVAYTKRVDVYIYGMSIRLQKGGAVLINGVKTFPPFSAKNGGVKLTNIGNNLYLVTECGLEVRFEWEHLVTVITPGEYRGNLSGICGDCDGQQNDFKTKDGTDVTGKPNKYSLIGNSYDVDPTSAKNVLDGNWISKCNVQMRDAVKTDKYCGKITNQTGVFQQCIQNNTNTADEYFESCEIDVCENDDKSVMNQIKCETMESFAEECKLSGYHVQWRSPTFCPLTCGHNAVYKHDGPGCPATCIEPEDNETCSISRQEGCFCKDGFVLSDDKCIKKTACGCVERANGNVEYFPLGHKKISKTCMESYQCKHVNGKSQFVKIPPSKPCHSSASCILNQAGERVCTCTFGYYGDGYSCQRLADLKAPQNTKMAKISLRFKNDYDATVGKNLAGITNHIAKALSETMKISLYRITNMKIEKGSVHVTFSLLPKRRGTTESSLVIAMNKLHSDVRLNNLHVTDGKGRELQIDQNFFKHTFHVTRPCECTGQGDPHYLTYDGQWIHFMGTCKYTLTKSTLMNDTCAFNVEVKNEHRGYSTHVSYTKFVEIFVSEMKIGMYKNGKVTVDGESNFLPITKNNGDLKVFSNGRYTQLFTTCGLQVIFDGDSYVKVKIPEKYRGHTTGICGVCNDKQDDFVTKDGTPVSPNREGQTMIGNSYKVPESSFDGCGDHDLGGGKCNQSMKQRVAGNDYCGLIMNKTGPFRQCINEDLEAAKKEYDLCIFDVCSYTKDNAQMEKAKCMALEGFAASCEGINIPVKWRTSKLCPLKCDDPNSEYRAEGTACPASCMDLRAPANCPLPPSEGCFCKSGLVKSHNTCVQQSQCGCVDDDDNYLPVGKQKVSTDCGMAFVCTAQLNGPPKLLKTAVSKHCHKNAICTNDVNGEKKCVCRDDFIGDGYDECVGVPSSANRVSVSLKLLEDFENIVGNDSKGFARHINTYIANLVGISKSRIINIKLTPGSILVSFDILPRSGGSKESKVGDVLSKLLLYLKTGQLVIKDLNGKNLKVDRESLKYNIDTSSPCKCTGSGDPHYRTFDGQMIDFMGTRRYTMAKSISTNDDCAFKVEVENEHRYGNYKVSYTKNVHIEISGIKIMLQKDAIASVDQNRVFMPYKSNEGKVEIISTGGNLFVTTKCGIKVSFERNHLVSVDIPGRYRKLLTGICGNCDGKQNDFKTADGVDVTRKTNKFNLIGESYLVGPKSNSNGSLGEVWNSKCSTGMQSLVETENYCGLLKSKSGSFKDCINLHDDLSKEYFESCKIDVCANENEENVDIFKCMSIEGFYEECVENGIPLTWPSLNSCDMTCDDPNKEFKEKGPGCPPTCLEPSGQTPCPIKGSRGCFCKPGFFLSDNKCVNTSNCGCKDLKGDYYPVGHKIMSSTCLPSLECKHVNGRSMFVKVVNTKPCHTNASCYLNNKGERTCKCDDGFYGDGYSACTELPNLQVPTNTKRMQISIKFSDDYAISVGSNTNGFTSHISKALSEILNIKLYRISNLKIKKGSILVTFDLLQRRLNSEESTLNIVLNTLHRYVRLQTLPLTDHKGKQLHVDPTFFQQKVVVSRPCECTGQGDPHYLTYDGQWIHFMGTCKYTLTKSTLVNDTCAFNVEVKNEHRGYNKKVSYTKFVEINIMKTKIGIYQNNRVLVDGESQFLPITKFNGELKVFSSGKYTTLLTTCGLHVTFDGNAYVKVKIPEKYRGHTTGICGVCNDKQDDFVTKEGIPVNSNREGQTMIGNSYRVLEDSADGCDDQKPAGGECSQSMKERIGRDDYCGLILNKTGPFKYCIEEDPEVAKDEFDLCQFDVCSYAHDKTQLEIAKCNALEGFAASCEGMNIPVKWRSSKICPMKCNDPNSEYLAEGTACPASCMNLRAPDNCPLSPVEGCFCKSGYVKSHDKCVPQGQCGCVDDDGNYIPLGQQKTSKDCGFAIVCTAQNNGPAKLIKTATNKSCHKNAVCTNDANGDKKCNCKQNFLGNGYASCEYVPSSTNRVLVAFRLLEDFEEIVGNDSATFTTYLKTYISKAAGISESRIINMQVENGSIITHFDILPARSGSLEPNIAEALNKMFFHLLTNRLVLKNFNDKSLKVDEDYMKFSIDTSRPCTCTGSGDPHYRTFDGQMIHFMGTRRYTMAKSTSTNDDCAFKVEVENEHRYGNYKVSYTKNVYIKISNIEVMLQKDRVASVNGNRVFMPYTSREAEIEIKISGGNLYVTTKCGIAVSFENNHLVSIEVPGRYRGILTGICGNCDGKPNDFTTASGEDVTGKRNKFTLIGESYLVGPKPNSTEKLGDDDWNPQCSTRMQALIDTEQYCGLLSSETGSFRECIMAHSKLSKEYFESCKVDVCENENEEGVDTFKCMSIEGFYEECVENGITMKWPSSDMCRIECDDPNKEFKENGPGCPPTCLERSGQNPCPIKGTRGCFCKQGFLLSDNKCVNVSDCGCKDIKGDYFPIGHRIISSTCVPSLECKNVNGKAVFVKAKHTKLCHDKASCQLDSKGERTCTCKDGFYGDGYKACHEIKIIKIPENAKKVKVTIRFDSDFSKLVGNNVNAFNDHLRKAFADILALSVYRIMDMRTREGSIVATFYITERRHNSEERRLEDAVNVLHKAVRTRSVHLTNHMGTKLILNPDVFLTEPVLSRPCTCIGQGDPHYKTFDGQTIDFMGTCTYTLTKSTKRNDTCDFHVKVKNEHRGTNTAVSYTKFVILEMYGVKVTLQKHGIVLINGVKKGLPITIGNKDMEVFRSGRFVQILTSCALKVAFDGNAFVSVQIPDRYRGHTTGICGVCDDKQNDFMTKEGDDVTTSPNRDKLIGDSYQVDESVDDCDKIPQGGDKCSPDLKKEVASARYCGIISDPNGPFRACLDEYKEIEKIYVKTCQFDVCANVKSRKAMDDARCLALEALAEECDAEGITVKWRSSNICPLKCVANAFYSSIGTACPPTCMNIRAPTNCQLPPREGCFCSKGFVMSDGKCVRPNQCGCLTKTRDYISLGEKVSGKNCGNDVKCQSQKDGQARLITIKTGTSCHVNGVCLLDNNGERSCQCKDGFIGDGINSCKAMPSSAQRVSVSFKFSNKFDEVIGKQYQAYRKYFMTKLASYIGISTSRVTNMRIAEGSIAVNFDILPKRPGSKEKSLSQAVSRLLKDVSKGILRISNLDGNLMLNAENNSFTYYVDVSKPCTCMAYGDPHYKTYDGEWIHFMGTCKYIMTKSTLQKDHCAFEVKVQNENRGSNMKVSFTKFVDVVMYGVNVRLSQKGQLMIDGEAKHLPLEMPDIDLEVFRSGKFVRVKSGCGVIVEFDGDALINVHIPGKYRNNTIGICGQCDGVQNDMVTQEGVDVSAETDKYALIGKSFKIPEESTKSCKNNNASTESCSSETLDEVKRSDSCGIIINDTGPFSQCITDSPDLAKDFFTSCKFDVCSYEEDPLRKKLFLCSAIEAFADYCAELDIPINWRSTKLCPMTCKPNEVYKIAGPGCEATCVDPRADKRCSRPTQEGCFCKDGFIRSDNNCVKPEDCGCLDTDGEYYPIGTKKTSRTCTESKICKKVGSTVTFVEVPTLKCHTLATCQLNSRGERMCVCQEGYEGDGQTNCTSVCKKENTMYYMEGKTCISTCLIHVTNAKCKTNEKKGCYCKEGYVLHGGKCIERALCGCLDDKKMYHELGATIPGDKCGETYQCQKGSKRSSLVIKTKGNTCHRYADCIVSSGKTSACKCRKGYTGDGIKLCSKPRNCFCMVSSSTRYRTFDRQRLDFTGTCKYTLAKTSGPKNSCSFDVTVKNEHRYGSKTRAYTHSVEVDVHGMEIKLLKGSKVEVDGKRRSLPIDRSKMGLKVLRSGRYIVLLSNCGLQVKFDGRHIATVKVPGKYRGKMTGLCGNCNGNKKDDFRTNDGTDVSGKKNGADLIGKSYKVVGSSCD